MKITNEMLNAVDRYASAERSDPFARGRAIAHLKSGIGIEVQKDKGHFVSCYDAEEQKETRIHPLTGKPFKVTVYRNITRA